MLHIPRLFLRSIDGAFSEPDLACNRTRRFKSIRLMLPPQLHSGLAGHPIGRHGTLRRRPSEDATTGAAAEPGKSSSIVLSSKLVAPTAEPAMSGFLCKVPLRLSKNTIFPYRTLKGIRTYAALDLRVFPETSRPGKERVELLDYNTPPFFSGELRS